MNSKMRAVLIALIIVSAMLMIRGSGATAPVRQQSADARARLHEFADRMKSPENQTNVQALALKLSRSYPRLAHAVRKGKIDFKTFLFLRERGNDEADKLLQQLEEGTLDAGELVERVKQHTSAGDFHTQDDCEHSCDWWTQFYVDGCFDGGGDTWRCYILGEQFMCFCINGCTGYGYRDCGLM